MSVNYNGLHFNTSLLAQWAAFFDLAGWSWWSNPQAIDSWQPDFKVEFPCGHSECGGSHTIYVTVSPIDRIDDSRNHPALKYMYTVEDENGRHIADAGALFGENPGVSEWQMSHGSGGGIESIDGWVPNSMSLWAQAGSIIEHKKC